MAQQTIQPSADPNPSSGSGSSKVAIIIIVVVVVLILIGVAGWYVARRTIGKVTGITGSSYQYSSGSDTISAGESVSWPTEIPSYVPKFESGTIKGTAHIDATWTVTFTYVSSDEVNAYKQTLKDNGWKISAELDNTDLISYNAENSAGEKIICVYTKSEKSAIFSFSTE